MPSLKRPSRAHQVDLAIHPQTAPSSCSVATPLTPPDRPPEAPGSSAPPPPHRNMTGSHSRGDARYSGDLPSMSRTRPGASAGRLLLLGLLSAAGLFPSPRPVALRAQAVPAAAKDPMTIQAPAPRPATRPAATSMAFEVSLDPELDLPSLDGRLFIALSRASRPEPRLPDRPRRLRRHHRPRPATSRTSRPTSRPGSTPAPSPPP